jgi:hypothetical protein
MVRVKKFTKDTIDELRLRLNVDEETIRDLIRVSTEDITIYTKECMNPIYDLEDNPNIPSSFVRSVAMSVMASCVSFLKENSNLSNVKIQKIVNDSLKSDDDDFRMVDDLVEDG